MKESRANKRIIEWSVVAGIIIVLNLLFNYALAVFYPAPVWGDFCPDRVPVPYTEEICTAEGGLWHPESPKLQPEGETLREGYCDLFATCQKNYDQARDVHNRLVFIILVVLGVISVALGVLLPVRSVSTGLAYGGVLSLIIASIRYWPSADDYIKLLILAAALAILVWIGVKKFR